MAFSMAIGVMRDVYKRQVRPHGAGVNLVRHQVVQLEHVGLAYHHRVVEGFAGQAVIALYYIIR